MIFTAFSILLMSSPAIRLNLLLSCTMSHSMRACRKLKTCSTRSSESEQMIAPRLRELAERVWAAMAAEFLCGSQPGERGAALAQERPW